MSDDPLEPTSWDVKRLYSEGHGDRAERLARYLRGRESGEQSEATPGEAWVRCPHCGSDDVDVELRGGRWPSSASGVPRAEPSGPLTTDS